MNPFYDKFGEEVKIGDTIAYCVRHSCGLEIKKTKVVDIQEFNSWSSKYLKLKCENTNKKYKFGGPYPKYVWLSCPEYIIKLKE